VFVFGPCNAVVKKSTLLLCKQAHDVLDMALVVALAGGFGSGSGSVGIGRWWVRLNGG